MNPNPNFEYMNRGNNKQMPAWKIAILLLVVNIAGFAVASSYFSREKGNHKTETQATEQKADFGAKVSQASNLAEWGYHVLMILRGSR
jgi:hypothetical protein